MNKILFPLFALALFAAPLRAQVVGAEGPETIYPAADAGPTWAEVRENGEGTLRVIYVPADGFAYVGDDGVLTGVSVEIMRDFAVWLAIHRDVHVDLDFRVEESWPHFMDRVRSARGGVIGLGNVTITAERREAFGFSPPYLTNVAVLITHDAVAELSDLADVDEAFAGLAPLAFGGTLHEVRLRRLAPGAEPSIARSNDEIVERVAGGGYFAYIDAYNYFRAREHGAPLRRHAVADDPGEEFGFIMPHGSDWREPLDAFFAAHGGYLRTDRYRDLLVEHLGEGVAAAVGS